MYKQCKLKRVDSETFHTAWIPAELAVKGKIIQFKHPNGFWHEKMPMFEVVSAGFIGASGELVREMERDYLHQRKASDI
jgi:hypothetical protein